MSRSAFCFTFKLVLFALAPMAVAQVDTPASISMYGIALPKNQVMLRSSIEGHVRSVHVVEGQMVKKGDLLVELNCDAALAKRNIAKLAAEQTGEIASAKAELEFAEDNFERVSRLVSRKAMIERDLKEAQFQLDRARASFQTVVENIESNRARFELAQAELEQYYFRAPFDGQVTQISVTMGDSVSINTDMLQLVCMDKFRVELYLPLEVSKRIKIGQKHSLQIESPFAGKVVEGRVVYRSPLIEATTQTLRFIFEIDNQEYDLPAGFTVSLAEVQKGLVKTTSSAKPAAVSGTK